MCNFLEPLLTGFISGLLGGRRGCCRPMFPDFRYMCSTLPYHVYGYEDTGVYLPMPTRLGVYDYLLDPNYTILQYKQYLQSRQNTHFSNLNIPGLDQLRLTNQSQQVQQTQQVNTNTAEEDVLTDEQKVEEKLYADRYNDLVVLLNIHLNKLKVKNKSADIEMIVKIENAISKSGTIKERYDALAEVYKLIDKKALKKSLLEVSPKLRETVDAEGNKVMEYDPDDPTLNILYMLENSGYHFGLNDDSDVNSNDALLVTDIDKAFLAASNISASNPNGAVELESLIKSSAIHNDILRVLSLWNDKYNTNENRCIIRLIKKQMSGLSSIAQADIINKYIKPLTEAMIFKANELKDNSLINENSKNEIISLSTTLQQSLTTLSAGGMDEFISVFEKLYVAMRKAETSIIQDEIRDRYSFLDDIDNVTFIKRTNLINIKPDLVLEGFEEASEDDELRHEAASAPEELKTMVEDGILRAYTWANTPENTYYGMPASDDSNSYSLKKSALYTVKDGKIYLLKDIDYLVSVEGENGPELKAVELDAMDMKTEVKNLMPYLNKKLKTKPYRTIKPTSAAKKECIDKLKAEIKPGEYIVVGGIEFDASKNTVQIFDNRFNKNVRKEISFKELGAARDSEGKPNEVFQLLINLRDNYLYLDVPDDKYEETVKKGNRYLRFYNDKMIVASDNADELMQALFDEESNHPGVNVDSNDKSEICLYKYELPYKNIEDCELVEVTESHIREQYEKNYKPPVEIDYNDRTISLAEKVQKGFINGQFLGYDIYNCVANVSEDSDHLNAHDIISTQINEYNVTGVILGYNTAYCQTSDIFPDSGIITQLSTEETDENFFDKAELQIIIDSLINLAQKFDLTPSNNEDLRMLKVILGQASADQVKWDSDSAHKIDTYLIRIARKIVRESEMRQS